MIKWLGSLLAGVNKSIVVGDIETVHVQTAHVIRLLLVPSTQCVRAWNTRGSGRKRVAQTPSFIHQLPGEYGRGILVTCYDGLHVCLWQYKMSACRAKAEQESLTVRGDHATIGEEDVMGLPGTKDPLDV